MPMSRGLRALFYTGVVFLWLAVLAAALEIYARVQQRREEAATHTYEKRGGEELARREEAVVREYGDGPLGPATDVAERAAFSGLDEQARHDFVVRRHELVLLCDTSGVAGKSYVDPAHAQLAVMSSWFGAGVSVADALPAAEGSDARACLQQVLDNRTFATREYELPLGNGEKYICQAVFHPYADGSGKVTQVGVFFRDSMWIEMWSRFRPNVRQFDVYDFTTNSAGFRDDEVVVPKPAGVVRVACVGGSTTAEGPTNALTYPNILEKKLRRHFNTDRIEVVNCGVFAVNSGRERANIDTVLALQPDLLVHYNFVNDVTYGLEPFLRQGPAGAWARVLNLLRHSTFLQRYFNRWFLPDDIVHDFLESQTIPNMRAVIDAARAAGSDVALASFACPDIAKLDSREEAYFNRIINTMLWGRFIDIRTYTHIVGLYNGSLEALCAETGCLYVPVAESLGGGSEIFNDICHMNLYAMERKADTVFQGIRDYVQARLDQNAGQ